MKINWKEILFWGSLVLLVFMLGAKASTIGTFTPSNEIQIVSQTGADVNITYSFTELNSTHWNASFCVLPSTTFNALSYPLANLTPNIAFEQVSPIRFNVGTRCGWFYLIFPKGFVEGESARFGTGTTIINSATISPYSQNQRAICRDGDGNLHAVFRTASNTIRYANSSDNGTTWDIKNMGVISSIGTPHISCSGDNITICYTDSGASAKVHLNISTNNGASFNGVDLNYAPNSAVGSSVCERRGTWIYLVYIVVGTPYANYTNSSDGGTTWAIPIDLSGASGDNRAYYPSLVVNGTGNANDKLYVSFRFTSSIDLYFNASINQGQIWSIWNNSVDINQPNIPSMVHNGSHLFVVYYDSYGTYGNGIWIRNSTDNGATWGSARVQLNTTPMNFSNPTIGLNNLNYPIVCWGEGFLTTDNYNITCANFTGTSWQSTGYIQNNQFNNTNPNLKALFNNNRIEYLFVNGTGATKNITYDYLDFSGGEAPPEVPIYINVSLISPLNDTWNASQTIIHSYNTSIEGGEFKNCTLFTNHTGTFASRTGNSTPIINNSINTISYNYGADTSKTSWNVYCYNLTGSGSNYSMVNLTIKIDTSAPTTSASATDDDTNPYTYNTWVKSAYITNTLTCSDGSGIGCSTTKYCTDITNTCTPVISYSSPFAVSTEGTSYIRYNSSDSMGWVETIASQTIKIDTTAPTQVSGLTNASTGSTWVNLSWSASSDTGGSGVAKYMVWRSGVNVANTTNLHYNDSGILEYTSYSYKVGAVDSVENFGVNSTTLSITTHDITPPTQVSNLQNTSVHSNWVSLSWSASTDSGSGVKTYLVYRNSTNVGNTTDLTYIDSGLFPLNSYGYRVGAIDNYNNFGSNSSLLVYNTTYASTPAQVSGLHTDYITEGQIWLGWDSTLLADVYLVWRNGTNIGNTTGITYKDIGLRASFTYEYIVGAYNITEGSFGTNSTPLLVNTSTQFGVWELERLAGQVGIQTWGFEYAGMIMLVVLFAWMTIGGYGFENTFLAVWTFAVIMSSIGFTGGISLLPSWFFVLELMAGGVVMYLAFTRLQNRGGY